MPMVTTVSFFLYGTIHFFAPEKRFGYRSVQVLFNVYVSRGGSVDVGCNYTDISDVSYSRTYRVFHAKTGNVVHAFVD